MTDTELLTQPGPATTPSLRPRSAVPIEQPAAEVAPLPEEQPEPIAPVADLGAPMAPAPEAAPGRAAAAAPPPARGWPATTAPIMVPWESALPCVTSADIRAELARRERHAVKLLAERELVIQQMEAIEEALKSIG